jgi:hypothetical protein
MDMALRAAGEDRFKALIECVLPLSKAAEAHAIVAERTIIGKVVLDPTQ